MPIPKLNGNGVSRLMTGIRPIRPQFPIPSHHPWLCEVFANTPERRAILKGFLELRAALRQLQIVNGFQWVDGQFLEDDRQKRTAPDHIQVVTFFHPSPTLKTRNTLTWLTH